MRFVPVSAPALVAGVVVAVVVAVFAVGLGAGGCVDRNREAALQRLQLVVDEQRAADAACAASMQVDDVARRADLALDCRGKRQLQLERYQGLMSMVPSPSSSERVPAFPSPPAVLAEAPLDGDGKRLFQTQGCVACHSLDGSRLVGQSVKGLFGSTVTHNDDSTAVVDDAYLVEAILRPGARVTKGYVPVMPVYEGRLNAATVEVLIKWMKTQR